MALFQKHLVSNLLSTCSLESSFILEAFIYFSCWSLFWDKQLSLCTWESAGLLPCFSFSAGINPSGLLSAWGHKGSPGALGLNTLLNVFVSHSLRHLLPGVKAPYMVIDAVFTFVACIYTLSLSESQQSTLATWCKQLIFLEGLGGWTSSEPSWFSTCA